MISTRVTGALVKMAVFVLRMRRARNTTPNESLFVNEFTKNTVRRNCLATGVVIVLLSERERYGSYGEIASVTFVVMLNMKRYLVRGD